MNRLPAPATPETRRHTRREFLAFSAAAVLCAAGPGAEEPPRKRIPILDLHQHLTLTGRTDREVLLHQQNTGATVTILQPAGETGGLGGTVAGCDHVRSFAAQHADRFA